MKKSAFILLVAVCVVFGLVGSAYAYWASYRAAPWAATGKAGWGPGVNTPVPSLDCLRCHGAFTTNYNGVHGGFTDLTDSCASCHNTHNAVSVRKLLPASTEIGICMTCHDFSFVGTGGGGVYGALRARNVPTRSRHAIEGYNNVGGLNGAATLTVNPAEATFDTTNVIPGGQAWGLLTTNVSGNTNLSCEHCHTPHGTTNMQVFNGERARSNVHTITSNRILQDDLLGTPRGTYTVYGSYWCAGCHKDRHTVNSTVYNHPAAVPTGLAFGDPSINDGVSWVAGAWTKTGNINWWSTIAAGNGLPLHQAGWSRLATDNNKADAWYWAPECQQCHYNTRNVEAAWSLVDTSGPNYLGTSNPQFQSFPHEGAANKFKVESGDDLCLNCHPTSNLP
jgi:predicted CXXCH cytochrome family protein